MLETSFSWMGTTAFALVMLASMEAKADFVTVPGDHICPEQHRLMSYSYAFSRRDEICNALQDWAIARLAGRGSISGAGNNCEIYKIDHRQLGTSLCVAFVDFSEIRGVLLAGGFRSQSDLVSMSEQDWRAALITELANRTAGSHSDYEGLDNVALAGVGMLLIHQLGHGRKNAQDIALMTARDIRAIAIRDLNRQTGISMKRLSDMSDLELSKLFLKG